MRRQYIELKQTQQELAASHAQALQVSRLKSQLLANVSHDLRTPLNAILGYAEMLREGIYGSLQEKQCIIIQKIIQSTGSLTELVNQLLDQTQLDAGIVKLRNSSFAPSELIERVRASMEALTEAKGLELTSEIAADMPPSLVGDPDRLHQILSNLVGNAIKFTERGSVRLLIYCPDEAHWAMQVSDTGPGIPSEAQAYVFEPFWQADGSMTRKYSGTGLGLSIVKQLVTLMGGLVTVESEVGQGSAFTVLLPLTPLREIAL
jgi:signal transduction histidine kinase